MNQSPIIPSAKYRLDIQSKGFSEDPNQLKCVELFDDLFERILFDDRTAYSLRRLFDRIRGKKEPLKGLYFWGGVGRGKTYLMDMFFDLLPILDKKRLHFHRFMHSTHEQLNRLKGQPDPLKLIAEELAEKTRIICFDEFYVKDITDAMILGGLFEALFERGVSLVATSNIPPAKLYWNGLQRERFLPAIELIQKHCQIVNLDSGIDYRLRTLEKAEIFHCPHDQRALATLNYSFDHLATEELPIGSVIQIEHRPVHTLRCAEGIIWFSFKEICETARSNSDYIEISRCYQTVIVSDIPQMVAKDDAAARRFISLVDEFYDRHVNLIITAAVDLEFLYVGRQLAFEFKRTLSRLQEMQSTNYLALEHLA